MTGFYIGDTYLENNVFHYFENRINKIIKGKTNYLSLIKQYKSKSTYKILNNDAKHLPINDNTIDFVFTDFPYGDTVPYFEQSQIWNAWLDYNVDYNNEIVVSNSSERQKDISHFEKDIDLSIKEINRVLKHNKYFIFTFNSLSGKEWTTVIKSLKNNNFKFIKCEILLQKTLPPRQLNRNNTIKGDIIVVYKKSNNDKLIEGNFYTSIENYIKNNFTINNLFETNDLIVLCIETMLKINYIDEINFKKIINKYFIIDCKTNKWRIKE